MYVESHSQITLAADARELPTKRIARACAGIERAVRHDDSEGIMEESRMMRALSIADILVCGLCRRLEKLV